MKISPRSNVLLILAALLIALMATGCGDKATTRDIEPETGTADSHAGHDHAGSPADGDHSAAAEGNTGTVLETMNSGGYTYVHLDMGDKQVWAAGPTVEGIEVGQKVGFSGAMEMRNFTAKSLDRTFETILFVGALTKDGEKAAGGSGMGMGGGMGGMPKSDEPISGTKTKLENAHIEGVEKAAGGYTVSEIYAQADKLAGKEVTLRGQVVKYSPGIMGKNWLHIQDGSGDDNTSDLTVTTDGHAQVGDLVLVKGPLSVDKDFGAGYKYHVIVEGATVSKQ